MIDLRSLRENPEPARASQRARGADEHLVDRLLAADVQRREALAAFESLRAEQKALSATIGKASKEERPAILAKAQELSQQVKELEAAAKDADAVAQQLLYQIPNLVLEGVPAGGEDDFEVKKLVGQPRTFDFR